MKPDPKEEHKEHTFDSYCKRILKNESSDYHRRMNVRRQYEIPFAMLPHASLLISMGENPLLIKERLGHEKIQTTLGTYGHLYPNSNLEVANKLTGVLTYTPASHSIADYTSNQHTAAYHKEVE